MRICIKKGCPATEADIGSYFQETRKFMGTWRVLKQMSCSKCKSEWKTTESYLTYEEIKDFKKKRKEQQEAAKKALPIVQT